MAVKNKAAAGFTLLEVMIASAVLAVGLVSLLGLFTNALATMQFAQEEMIAKQKARDALESIYAARNTQQITFDMIANVSNGGVFLDGFQPLRVAGPDGLVGTADDGAIEELVYPGPDGVLGTADDEHRPLTNFDRQILIAPVPRSGGGINFDLSQVTVTVRYTIPQFGRRSYVVSSFVSRWR